MPSYSNEEELWIDLCSLFDVDLCDIEYNIQLNKKVLVIKYSYKESMLLAPDPTTSLLRLALKNINHKIIDIKKKHHNPRMFQGSKLLLTTRKYTTTISESEFTKMKRSYKSWIAETQSTTYSTDESDNESDNESDDESENHSQNELNVNDNPT